MGVLLRSAFGYAAQHPHQPYLGNGLTRPISIGTFW